MKSSSKPHTHEIQQLQSYEVNDSLNRLELKKDHLIAFSLIAGVASIYLFLQGTYTLELFGSYGLNIFMTAAAILGLISYARIGKSPFSLVSLGFALGLVSWVSGLWFYTYTYYIANADLPYISMADAFYLMSYPPMIWGTISLLRLFARSLKRMEWLTLAAAGTAFTILMIPYVILPSIEGVGGLTQLEALVTVLYPLMDAAVFLLLFPLFLAFRKGVIGLSFALIASGAAMYTLGDIALTYVNLTTGYFDGHPLDLLLFSGCILVGYGFWRRQSDMKSIVFDKRIDGRAIKLDRGAHCVYCNLEVRDPDVCQVCQRIARKLFQAEPSYTGCSSSGGSLHRS